MYTLNLVTKVINKESIGEDLSFLFDSLDADFSGINGEEYLWDIAKENGFKSNLDYALDEAINKFGDDLESVIKHVLTSAQSTWSGYYDDWKDDITEVNGEFVVSVTTIA